jgi:fermentation-respiration switch protein FrsA (DUF1100 family)
MFNVYGISTFEDDFWRCKKGINNFIIPDSAVQSFLDNPTVSAGFFPDFFKSLKPPEGMESLPPPNLDETPPAYIQGPWKLYDYFIQEGLFDKYLGTSENLNPLNYMDKSFPPTVLVHGDTDALVPLYFSERIVSTLRGNGGTASLMVVSGGDHGFEAL